MEEEKRIDNKILDTLADNKQKIKMVDEEIDVEKQKMKDLDEIEGIFVSLNSSISKCVELLSQSIKGESIDRKLGAIEESNKVSFNNSIYNIDSEIEEIKTRMKRLYDEKDEYQERLREELNKGKKNNDE